MRCVEEEEDPGPALNLNRDVDGVVDFLLTCRNPKACLDMEKKIQAYRDAIDDLKMKQAAAREGRLQYLLDLVDIGRVGSVRHLWMNSSEFSYEKEAYDQWKATCVDYRKNVEQQHKPDIKEALELLKKLEREIPPNMRRRDYDRSEYPCRSDLLSFDAAVSYVGKIQHWM